VTITRPDVTPAIDPDAFRARFVLASFPDGGIVLDLATGSYARLNLTALTMLEELARAATEQGAADAAAARLHISPALALRDMQGLVTDLLGSGVRNESPDSFQYRPAPDGGYDLWHGDLRALHADPTGRRLTLGAPLASLRARVVEYVSDIAPKLMFLQGVTVVHGSSCGRDGRLLAFCGKSRAGKTTTARTFARHGASLVSEDLLVFAPDESPAVFLGGERIVANWYRQAAERLAAAPADAVDAAPLGEAARGATIPLCSIWFLDARRRGHGLNLTRLGGPDALALLLSNAFLGAREPALWREHLARMRAFVLAVTACEASVPDGIDELDAAIARYTTNSAS
jgi:hypothetical protein